MDALIGYFDDGTQLPMITAMFTADIIGLVSHVPFVRRSRPTDA